ncbi:sensor histidine kinase [Actinopolymorpha alba]|uniref:sensor histidine kinase n=1 Tax=Actinopolymorpha alba TaxID=533267 RepID=UPI00036A0746|nr:GAF domain-containing sensor histidine kinase [Actinopolymorpha alba]
MKRKEYLDLRGFETRRYSVLDAILAVDTDLDLNEILARVAQVARLLLNARYAVLAVTTTDDLAAATVPSGLSTPEARQLGDSRDLLTSLARLFPSTAPSRWCEIHPPPAGPHLSPGIPPTTSMVGARIAIGGDDLGFLWAGDKVNAPEFTPEDDLRLATIAIVARTAIGNARLRERERRRQQWLEAAADLNRLLFEAANPGEALRWVDERIRTISGASWCGIFLLDPSEPSTIMIESIQGPGIDYQASVRSPLGGLREAALKSGRCIVSTDLISDPRYSPSADWPDALDAVGPAVIVPLLAPGEAVGTLVLAWPEGPAQVRTAVAEAPMLEFFASRAALAFQQVSHERRRSRLRVLADRDRIAQDLNDTVIQRLFAVGTLLESARGLTRQPEVRDRVGRAVTELDKTTQHARAAVFQLRTPDPADVSSVRSQLFAEIDAARELLGSTPRLVLHGRVDTVSTHMRSEIMATVHTALLMAARQDPVSDVEVRLEVDDTTVRLTVAYAGAPPSGVRSRSEPGLADLVAQAERLGGSCTVHTDDAGMTTLDWCVRKGA